MSNMPYAVTNTIQVRCPSSQLHAPEIPKDMPTKSMELSIVGLSHEDINE